ncbi:MAG: hypothetical protein HFG25_12545 [Lachnospiraceae bacterium]|nr:hypothetical protein [Lachnospiraceae bacterium]
MKKGSIIFPIVTLSLLLSACGAAPAPDKPSPSGTPQSLEGGSDNALDQSPDASREDLQNAAPESSQIPPQKDNQTKAPDEDTHSHVLSSGNNVIEHDPAGYCGNTVTTVVFHPTSGDGWECSFWGSDSVNLTDLLRFLDYSEGICRCMPEYTVSTEFDQNYGINLTEGYVRCEDEQVSLTAEQLDTIRDILERVSADK